VLTKEDPRAGLLEWKMENAPLRALSVYPVYSVVRFYNSKLNGSSDSTDSADFTDFTDFECRMSINERRF